MPFNQQAYTLRLEWGLKGVEKLAPISDVVIIVDVLSFTTSVDIAVSRGATVFPYRWADESVYDYAASVTAEVANRQHPKGIALSPSSLGNVEAGMQLVMPSPNGSTLTLATGDTPTLAGCLRNARAVATAAQQLGKSIAVIPAGERWQEDNTLRPCVEDYLGAGAILSHLQGTPSAEASLAITAFKSVEDELEAVLNNCISGLDKASRNKLADVRLAGALNTSDCVPYLQNGAYKSILSD